MKYQTYTNDPGLLELVKRCKEAQKVWEEAFAESERLFNAGTPQWANKAIDEADKTLRVLHSAQTALSVAFIFALEHPMEKPNQ